jgi:DNA topoisomerase VI subunit A
VDINSVLAQFTDVGTHGPRLRYSAVLFVEKEGFDALWDAVELASRFDIAIMSTKGVSVTAARRLVERLSEAEIPIYVLHDFDKAGFTILRTLRETTRRYQFREAPRVIDLGLRLDDIEAMPPLLSAPSLCAVAIVKASGSAAALS